jgi:hypothetical protein
MHIGVKVWSSEQFALSISAALKEALEIFKRGAPCLGRPQPPCNNGRANLSEQDQFSQSSDGVATSREGRRSPRPSRVVPHLRWDRERQKYQL